MKKTLTILCVLVILILSACGNSNKTYPETTTVLSDNERVSVEITTSENETASETTERLSKTTEKSTASEEKDVHEVPPYVLRESLDDLKQIKAASETMSESEFSEFMDENFSREAMNGMNTLESTKRMLEELEETYIPLLDNNTEILSRISFYHEKNEIYQLISFDDETRLSAYVYTPENNREKKIQFSEELNISTVQSVKIGEYNMNLYEVEDADYSFFADVVIDDTYIIFKGKPNHSFEEFKAMLYRLTFVKIGDLLNE